MPVMSVKFNFDLSCLLADETYVVTCYITSIELPLKDYWVTTFNFRQNKIKCKHKRRRFHRVTVNI